MKIWITEIGEPLPLERNARLLRYGMMSAALASFGHDVVWWASNFSHAAKRFVCDEDREFFINGVTLKILAGKGYKKNISIRRIMHQKNFAGKFYLLAKQRRPPDLIISTVPTIETAKAAVRFGKEMNIPVIVDIRDEWPDEFVDLAPEPLRPVFKLLLYNYFKGMKFVCRNATGIVGVSESFLDYGLSFAGRPADSNDGFFPMGYSVNPVDEKKVREAGKWWHERGIDEKAFVCCFFGTIGKFFNLETVIRLAKSLPKKFEIKFVLCGDGSRLSRYQKMASGVSNVFFPGWVDAPKISALMEMADVGLAPYATDTRMALPNKPFEYFSGGLAVVSSIRGELKKILETNGCGLTYDPDSVTSLWNALKTLYFDRDLCVSMRNNAKKLAKGRFSVENISKRFNNHLIRVVENYNKSFNLKNETEKNG